MESVLQPIWRARRGHLIAATLFTCAVGLWSAAPAGATHEADDLAAEVAASVQLAAAQPAGATVADVEALVAGVTQATSAAAPTTTPAPVETEAAAPQISQYQTDQTQYHPDPAPVAPEAASPAAPAAPAPAGPVNVNVSVRVLSPGNDGPVRQTNNGVASPSGALPAPATPAQPGVAVTVNVNLNLDAGGALGSLLDRYHFGDPWYQNPHSIANWIPVSMPLTNDRWNASETLPDFPQITQGTSTAEPLPSAALQAETSARAEPRAERQPRGDRVGRAPRTRAPPHPTAAIAMARVPNVVLSGGAVIRTETRSARGNAAARKRPQLRSAGKPSLFSPEAPERVAGSAASGAGAGVAAFKVFAILIASLGVAALSSAWRLRLPAVSRHQADGSRPERPG